MNVVNVLGTPYTIVRGNTEQYPYLNDSDGYCDFTSKRIVIQSDYTGYEWEDMTAWYERVLRHELVHAYLFESGLDNNSDWGRNEEIVDWIALQLNKIHDSVTEALGR